MKIVREIAEALYDGTFRGGTPSDVVMSFDRLREVRDAKDAEVSYSESIIAAKLEPVREALSDLIETCTSADVMEYGERPDRETIRVAKTALALFEEE